MARTRKASIDNDKLTDTNIARVIKLLNPTPESGEKAITKKTACEILGIAYNTTRLGTLMESYEERIAKEKAKRAEKRGKPATNEETGYAIKEYLEGQPIDTIAKQLYRGTTFVRAILDSNDVPIRQVGHSYFKPELIPEGAVRKEFKTGETVYSSQYDVVCTIEKEYLDKAKQPYYRVWLKEPWLQYAYVAWYELGSLEHLQGIGIHI